MDGAMASVFTKIINGEIPGRFVWRDDLCAAFLTIAPINPGHLLLVPIKEVEVLWDLDEATYKHLWGVAKEKLEPAIKKAFPCKRVGVCVVGNEVPHAHIHLVPLHFPEGKNDLDFARAKVVVAEELDAAWAKLREAMG